ncbi:GNAT family N-acetyltransferase [Vreelandella zhaodongensis]|uniref:GNAT family N-acetyltransferase n=1 Tax=Vreelandella zhaodongensis TaxID=1176240 RepID=UPI003EB8ACFE
MALHYRKTRSDDVGELFDVRSKTRENPISIDRLAQMGITHAAVAAGIESGDLHGWVCMSQKRIVGFCTGDITTGEVLVLAVLPDFEGQGVGKQLLGNVVGKLRRSGVNPVWLAADRNSAVRAHGFYRRLGWVPTGEVLENGDEILEWRLT